MKNNFLSPKSESAEEWYKFEQFNFPLPETNDLFKQLKSYFSLIKDSYIKMNHINEDETLDIVRMILDQNYSVLGFQNRTYIIDKLKEKKINQYSDKIVDELEDPLDDKSLATV